MKRVLFVCHGNICRSPMAEFVMKKLVRDAGVEAEYEVASAATSTEELGNPVYPAARRELALHGIGCPGKRAWLLTRADYDRYDAIVGMDEQNMANMLRLFGGDSEGKLSLLLDHTGQHRSVADPWYTRDFGRAWDDIYAGCQALFAKLQAQ